MNSHQLQCFEAVYKEKSINKAARKLYMTPQGLGKTIQILEGELDTELFERTKLGVYPTESADYLHERAQVMLDHAALAVRYKGERIAMQEMRKQIGWYVKGLPHAAALRRDACMMNTFDDLRALLAREGFLTA